MNAPKLGWNVEYVGSNRIILCKKQNHINRLDKNIPQLIDRMINSKYQYDEQSNDQSIY
jgi:hypothetical protein